MVEIKVVTEQDRALRALIIGAPGTGKTSFCRDCHSEGGKSLLLASDSNYRALKGERNAVDIESWVDFVQAIDKLPLEKYDTVAVDTITATYELCQAAVCKTLGISHPSEDGFGKSWNAIRVELGVVLTRLEKRAKNLIYCAQEDTIEVQTMPGRTIKKVVADMGKAAKRRVNYSVSLIGRIEIGEKGERYLNFAPSKIVESKDTIGLFKDGTFPLDGRRLWDFIHETK